MAVDKSAWIKSVSGNSFEAFMCFGPSVFAIISTNCNDIEFHEQYDS